jgi:hypothetical protein
MNNYGGRLESFETKLTFNGIYVSLNYTIIVIFTFTVLQIFFYLLVRIVSWETGWLSGYGFSLLIINLASLMLVQASLPTS